jgi:hypothetical protein
MEIKALYTVSRLAEAAGITRFSMLRLLRRNGIAFLRSGRHHYVPLTELMSRTPVLLQSMFEGGHSR